MKFVFLDFDGVMDNAKYDIYLINTIFPKRMNLEYCLIQTVLQHLPR